MNADTNFRDLIYKDKDYEKEVDFIEECFEKFYKPKILEIGCGTGSYTKIFFERGCEITWLDVSENMLEIARKKCT